MCTATSILISDDCDSVAEVNDRFTTKNGLLVLAHMKRCCMAMSFTIPSGCYALVTRSGADLDYRDEGGGKHAVWPAGLHFPYPSSVGVSFFVTKRSTIIDLPVIKCVTKDDLYINIDMALTFRIMGDPDLGEDSNLVRKFVYEMTPCGLQHQLRDANDKAIRAIVRLVDHSKVYGIRSMRVDLDSRVNTAGVSGSILSDRGTRSIRVGLDNTFDTQSEEDYKIRDSMQLSSESEESDNDDPSFHIMTATQAVATILNDKFNALGVEIQSVVIKNMALSTEGQRQLQEKIVPMSENAEQQFFYDDDLQNTQMEDEVQTARQKFLEEVNQESQAGLEKRTIERAELNDEIAQANKLEKSIRQETRGRIETFLSQNDYEIRRVKDMMAAESATMEMKTAKLTVEQLANVKLECESVLTEATINSLANRIEADKLLVNAEGRTSSWLKKKHDFITQLRKIDVYDKLATNDSLILTSSTDCDINFIAVAEKILDERDVDSDETETSTSTVVAEVGILERLSRRYKENANIISPDSAAEVSENIFDGIDDNSSQSYETSVSSVVAGVGTLTRLSQNNRDDVNAMSPDSAAEIESGEF